LKRSLCFILATICVLTLFSVNVNAESKTLNTYRESEVETVNIAEGGRAQLQFKVSGSFTSVGINAAKSNRGKSVIVATLYKWDKNSITSRRGTPIASKEIDLWEADQLISLEFDKPLDAGEYFYDLYVKSGSFTVYQYKGNVVGAKNCYNDKFYLGSIKGQIVLSDTNGGFELTSEMTDFPVDYAPPESQIAADSNIAIMGVDPTKFAAIDDLGRTVDGYSQTGPQKDKIVGMFYWTWHDTRHRYDRPINITQLMEQHPELKKDFHHTLWNNYVGMNFWNEPLFGFYARTDKYVLRKHAEMLANAGVDFVLFDCTNGSFLWEDGYMTLLETWSEAREQGVKTPQVAFMLQFAYSGNTLTSLAGLYENLYSKNLYQDLWFYWEGKPLIMAHSSGLEESDPYQYQLLNYFTFRAGMPSYFREDMTDDSWGWLHVYPQALYKNDDGSVEMTTVGVAQNADYEKMELSAMNGDHNMGRSFTMQRGYSYSYAYRGEKIKVDKSIENSLLYGLNFQEQWDYAISVDPEIIFVTGWNEWVMGRFEEWCGVHNAFPDQYDDANSRDIEPSKGILKDHYYYQLVSNIRRFKGASKPDSQTTAKTIDITQGADQWQDSNIISYNYYTNNTYERNTAGYVGYTYTNEGTRNDIKTTKVSYDKDNVYFYVETVNALSPYTDTNWMRLLLDTQVATSDSKDWEEFEYILNRNNPTASEMVLERSTGDWNWEEVGKVSYTVQGNIMQVAVPRSMLGMTDRVTFNFKWCDNNLSTGDIMDVYTDGTAVPGGRFVFQFTSEEIPDFGEKAGISWYVIVIIAVGVVVIAAATVFVILKSRRKIK